MLPQRLVPVLSRMPIVSLVPERFVGVELLEQFQREQQFLDVDVERLIEQHVRQRQFVQQRFVKRTKQQPIEQFERRFIVWFFVGIVFVERTFLVERQFFLDAQRIREQ